MSIVTLGLGLPLHPFELLCAGCDGLCRLFWATNSCHALAAQAGLSYRLRRRRFGASCASNDPGPATVAIDGACAC